jgi:putative glutamine amidotransferase
MGESRSHLNSPSPLPSLKRRGRIAPPVIAVTGPDRGGAAAWLFTRIAIALAGGRAILITPQHPRPTVQWDALVIGGGADVDPELYGAVAAELPSVHRVSVPPGHSVGPWLVNLLVAPLIWLARKSAACCVQARRDDARDELELQLLDDAIRRGLPVLGICRGAQMINVYFGGSLLQDVKSFYVEDPEVRTILPRKRLMIEPGTVLSRILGRETVRVNALHRQAIDPSRLGRGLRIAARDRNGIVQAIELDGEEAGAMVLGVQWHPEFLPQLPRQRAIFRAVVKGAKALDRSSQQHGSDEERPTPHLAGSLASREFTARKQAG